MNNLEETCMDAVSEHSFTVDMNVDDIKPLPISMRHTKSKRKYDRITLPETYPKLEVEFYDIIYDCAEYIDKIQDIDTRVKMNKELSRVFVIRHKPSAMILFKLLVNLQFTGNN